MSENVPGGKKQPLKVAVIMTTTTMSAAVVEKMVRFAGESGAGMPKGTLEDFAVS